MSPDHPDAPIVPPPSRAVAGEGSHPVHLVKGLALLGGTAFSVTLAASQWSLAAVPEFASGNVLVIARRLVLLWLPLAVAGAVVAGLALVSVVGRMAPALIHRWGVRLCPLLPSALLPCLFARKPWMGQELPYLVLVGLTGLAWEQLIAFAQTPRLTASWKPNLSTRSRRLLRHAPFAVVSLVVLYYIFIVARYTLLNHVRMGTSTADLGEYDNQFFNALHGHPFRLPASEGNLRDWSALKFHADFIIYFLLPFYALRPGPEALLIIQTVVVALTAIPIFLFAARRVPHWTAAVLAIVFLLMPAVERPNFYDFHAVPVGMFFAAWAIWLVDRIAHMAPNGRARREIAAF